MSLPHARRPFLPFRNPFQMIPKGSYLLPELLTVMNDFGETLTERLKKPKPGDKEDVISISWMICAMESLCAIHTDIKALITALELPICDWDDKWIDVYLDNSVKLFDICIAFISEISRLNQRHLFLQCVLQDLAEESSKKFVRANSSLAGWRQHIGSKNPRLEECFSIISSLAQTLDLPKIKNSAKGKVLMRAMYGVEAVTVFVCNVYAIAFSGSVKNLMNLQVPAFCLWAEAFTDLLTFINTEMTNRQSSGRVIMLKELEAVDISVKKLCQIVEDGANPIEAGVLKNATSDLGKSANELSQGLAQLEKEMDSFFRIVLSGHDALLGNIRVGIDISNQTLSDIK